MRDMEGNLDSVDAAGAGEADLVARAHLGIMLGLQVLMLVELLLLIRSGEWMHVFLVGAIMTAILLPLIARKRLPFEIPSEIQIVAILFIFATLFLGEVRNYYERFWWWDLALHSTAGLTLGLLGFLVVYIMNENDLVDLRMRPSFVALFAFFFAVAIGTFWEVFEFVMDRTFGTVMQKPGPGDPAGLRDTMSDLIVDTLGALIVSFAGWRYLKRARKYVVDSWAHRFRQRYPALFGD
jgi:uncharacterized membrane protein YjdF